MSAYLFRDAQAAGATDPTTATLDALPAMPSVTLALSVFCLIEADICSTEAEVSSTLAACSLEACERLCAVES